MKFKTISFLVFYLLSNLLFAGSEEPSYRFAVFSDAHLYDTILGTDSKEFDDYIKQDRKLLKISAELMDEFVLSLERESIDFILFSGDMTKDGEFINHRLFKKYINKFKDRGVDVIVVNGNHDLVNHDAYDFKMNKKTKSANPDDFKSFYMQSPKIISRDEFSLSYVYQVDDGLKIFALDGCRYMDNPFEKHPIVGGYINGKTLKWIEENLKKAESEGSRVIILMHHGIVEHFEGQKGAYGDYILSNAEELKKLLYKYNVQIVFTGHFHANDVAAEEKNGKHIYDIETGSLVTYPSPYRIAEIYDSEKLIIKTMHIDSVGSMGAEFAEYSKGYAKEGIKYGVSVVLPHVLISQTERSKIGEKVSDMFCMHYAGDETYNKELLDFSGYSVFARIIANMKGGMFKGLISDSTPDNNVIIDLKNGTLTNF